MNDRRILDVSGLTEHLRASIDQHPMECGELAASDESAGNTAPSLDSTLRFLEQSSGLLGPREHLVIDSASRIGSISAIE